jgi:hypothetical protein
MSTVQSVFMKISMMVVLLCMFAGIAFANNTATMAQSYPVPVYSAHATQCQSGYSLLNSIDGSLSTIYHSDWNGNSLPDTLDYIFVDVQRIDTLIYYPRTDGCANGYFGQVEIWYASGSLPGTFVKLQNVDFGESSNVRRIALNGANGLLAPNTVRLIVKTGAGGFASCAEMNFASLTAPVRPVSCDLTQDLIPDVKQPVSGGHASNYQTGSSGEGPVEYSFDGDLSTIYHSDWSGGGFPITLEYSFTNVDQIDYMLYYPRTSGDNGLFKATEIWYSTAANPNTFAKLCDYDFQASMSATKVKFPYPLINPATIRVIVKSGQNNFASCAEMEFYKATQALGTLPVSVFTDGICSGLNAGVTQTEIDNMPDGFYKSLANCMLNGAYDASDRIRSYEAYPMLGATSTALKISSYSSFENPTGLYFDAGNKIAVFVDDDQGQAITMKVSDYSSGSNLSYPIHTGYNCLEIKGKGLGYINFYSDDYASLRPVKVHIAGGNINGVYDVDKSTDIQWKTMLANAKTNMIDLKGKHINMLYPVQYLKYYSPESGKALVQFYDSVVGIEFNMMGLYKYGCVPKNHMYAEATDEDGAWYGGGKGAHYGGGLDVTCNVDAARNDPWGIVHELGHINQIGPGLKWVSTTEVTNNIYSVWLTYLFVKSPFNKKLETETINDAYYDGYETGTGAGKGNDLAGGRFNAYLNNGIVKKERWLCQYGPDAMRESGNEPDWQNGNGDHFVKLCPLWQLILYFQVVHPEKKDWYADVAEKVRKTDETSLSQGQLVMNFLKNVCDATQTDLTDFFQKSGMLRTYNNYMNDYASAQLTITAADSVAVVNDIKSKGYPRPDTPVLYYLSANSVDAFKNRTRLTGVPGTGYATEFSAAEDYRHYIVVDHTVWQNVAVFETYANDQLIRISMVGAGSVDNTSTRVYFPSGSTSVYAVGWDGTRKLVMGVVTGSEDGHVTILPTITEEYIKIEGIDNNTQLAIVNPEGVNLYSHMVNNGEYISVRQLPPGFYLVKLTTANGQIFVKKLIKKS